MSNIMKFENLQDRIIEIRDKRVLLDADVSERQLMHRLTPQGIEKKLNLLMQFLRRKQSEYQMLEREIAQHLQEQGPHSPTEPPNRA